MGDGSLAMALKTGDGVAATRYCRRCPEVLFAAKLINATKEYGFLNAISVCW